MNIVSRGREFVGRSFTRPSSSLEYIPQIDGLRALAVLLVLGHHVFAIYLETTHRLGTQQLPQDWNKIAPLDPIVWWGINLAHGVQMFCVISGFVLAIPFARNLLATKPTPSVSRYLLRRLIRLEPPFILNMLFGFALLTIPWHKPWWYFKAMSHVYGHHLFWSILYLHGLVYADASWINGISWTLEIEVQFYLLLPLLAQLFRLHRPMLRRGILLVMVVASALVAQIVLPMVQAVTHNRRLDLSVLSLLQYFLAGMLLADFYLDPPRPLRLNPYLADALAVVFGFLLVEVVHYHVELLWMEPLFIAAFFFVVLTGKWTSQLFRLPLLTAIGTMSYTIYLYHFFILRWLIPLSSQMMPPAHALWVDEGLTYLVMLVPVLFISALLYLGTERPFVLLSHQVTKRLRARQAAKDALVPSR
jgi:peptidoglycan/LPS O-acetylase OafA/YrhL